MTKDNLKVGTRYWFSSGYRVRSGLYGGEIDSLNGNVIICEKNGDRWGIPASDLYKCEKDAVKKQKGDI